MNFYYTFYIWYPWTWQHRPRTPLSLAFRRRKAAIVSHWCWNRAVLFDDNPMGFRIHSIYTYLCICWFTPHQVPRLFQYLCNTMAETITLRVSAFLYFLMLRLGWCWSNFSFSEGTLCRWSCPSPDSIMLIRPLTAPPLACKWFSVMNLDSIDLMILISFTASTYYAVLFCSTVLFWPRSYSRRSSGSVYVILSDPTTLIWSFWLLF